MFDIGRHDSLELRVSLLEVVLILTALLCCAFGCGIYARRVASCLGLILRRKQSRSIFELNKPGVSPHDDVFFLMECVVLDIGRHDSLELRVSLLEAILIFTASLCCAFGYGTYSRRVVSHMSDYTKHRIFKDLHPVLCV